MIYLSPILFVAACIVYAVYSHWSIKRNENTWRWHLLQWVAAALFIAAGFVFGRWSQGFTFREFGTIMSAAVLGIPAYVYLLHYLNDNHYRYLMKLLAEEEND